MPATKDTANAKCRVTKKGHDRIFTGEHTTSAEGQIVFTKYQLNAVIELDPTVAAALEDKDLVEVLG